MRKITLIARTYKHIYILYYLGRESNLRVNREEGSNPADGFPLVDAPPDGPGGQVVDQEGHQE